MFGNNAAVSLYLALVVIACHQNCTNHFLLRFFAVSGPVLGDWMLLISACRCPKFAYVDLSDEHRKKYALDYLDSCKYQEHY
jgi:hypothetical protein